MEGDSREDDQQAQGDRRIGLAVVQLDGRQLGSVNTIAHGRTHETLHSLAFLSRFSLGFS
jgi:hypothetical protein